jgi:hypothetical protein
MPILKWHYARLNSLTMDTLIEIEFPEREIWRREFPDLLNVRFNQANRKAPSFISSFLHRVFPLGTLPHVAVEAILFSLNAFAHHTQYCKSFVINMFEPAVLKKHGRFSITTCEIISQTDIVLPVLLRDSIDTKMCVTNNKLALKDYRQLISTVNSQQNTISGQQDTIEGQQKMLEKAISDKDLVLTEKTELLKKISEQKLMLLQLSNCSSTETSMSSNLIAPEPDMLLLENVEVGPKCDLCKLETVSDKYKSQKWKKRCKKCLDRVKINNRNSKRKREEQN